MRSFLKKINSHFLLLLVYSFFFFSLIAINLSLLPQKKIPSLPISSETKLFFSRLKYLPPNPVLKKDSQTPPIVSAKAVLTIDMDSMVPLFEKDPDKSLFPASTTKIVTALIAMDLFGDDEVLMVDGLAVPGQDMHLVKGENISVRGLLEGLLIFSANDAAEVLAQNYPGGRLSFIQAMNKKAVDLSLTKTQFDNPAGFDSSANFSTARDLIRVAAFAMGNPRFAEIVGTKQKIVTSTDGKIVHKLASTNKLLGEVPGVLGVKTGWTEAARENLITYLNRDGHKIMLAVLGSSDRFGETKEIINWIENSYEWRKVSTP